MTVRNLCRRLRSLRKSQGFTLIEVLIGAMILLVALAGIVPFFLTGFSQASAIRYKSLATNIARERMEEIRQLDYREIIDSATLASRLGATASQRGIDFQISYAVEEASYDEGTLKKVTVNVAWAGPPKPSPAAITTMIHQQYLGPRGSLLEVTPSWFDPLGTPFPLISHITQVKYHIAQADWGLVFNNLNQSGMTARNVYARLVLFDSQGMSYPLGPSSDDHKLGKSYLHYTLGPDGKINDIWFEYAFDTTAIPDGYWELRAIAYNEYDQPGNVWRLRIRVEQGVPAAPTQFVATPQDDNRTVILTWAGGQERDRAFYILERRKWLDNGWSGWSTVSDDLDPNATSYNDVGVIGTQDPWGDGTTQNYYMYQLWAVDNSNPGKSGPAAFAEALIPSPTTTTTTGTTPTTAPTETTTTLTTPTTTQVNYSVQIKNSTNKKYSLAIKNSTGGLVDSRALDKNTTITVSDLPADDYLVTANASGRPTVTQSFSLQAQAGQIVLNIL